jgi:hypothetical protein
MDDIDVTALLRDLARAVPRARGHVIALRRRPDTVHGIDLFGPLRWVSTQSTFEILRSRKDDPAAPYLAAWTYALLALRVNQPALVAAAIARKTPTLQVEHPVPETISLDDATLRFLRPGPALVRRELERGLPDASAEVVSAERIAWERHAEIARRLGLGAPDDLLFPIPLADVEKAAEATLVATEDPAREAFAGAPSALEIVHRGGSPEADVPWPRDLSAGTLHDLFRGEAGWLDVPDLDVGELPRGICGASFTRAFARFGARWADAAASRERPFALAHHPGGLARLRTGALVGSLLSSSLFLVRVLGFSRPEAERTVRAQARVLLTATRLAAARVLLRGTALSGNPRRIAEDGADHVARALTLRPSASLSLAVPRLRFDDPIRLVAMLLAASDVVSLRDSFDEDWFKNPRALVHLRDGLGRSPRLDVTTEELSSGTADLARTLATRLA